MSDLESKKVSFGNITVGRIHKFFASEKRCFLLADETGLGKTVEAREFINKWYKEKYENKELKVLYIAPNLILAQKNIKKLVHREQASNTEILSGDRLSTGVKGKEKDKKIKYWAITPAVSFFLEGGKENERKNLKNEEETILNESAEAEKKNVEKFKNAYGELKKDPNREIDSTKARLSEEDEKILDILKKDDNDFIFTLEGHTSKDKDNLKKKLSEKILSSRVKCTDSTSIRQYWFDAAFIYKYVDNNKYSREELTVQQINEAIKNIYNNGVFLKDKSYHIRDFGLRVKKYEDFLNKNGKLKKEINGIEEEDLTNLKDSIQKYAGNQDEGAADFELIGKCKYLIMAFSEVCEFYLDIIVKDNDLYLRNQPGKEESWQGALVELFDETEIAAIKQLDRTIDNILLDSYWKLYFYYLRLASCIYYVKNWEPDLVIFDEFQNYPKIFNKDNDDDLKTKNIRKILKAVSGDNTKILMLSATPYSYHNIIPADEGGQDEKNQFLNHIGMEDILTYMKEQNGETIDHSSLFTEYHESLDNFVNSFNYMDDNAKRNAYGDLSAKAKDISKALYNAGISRNERPTSNYDLKGESLYVSPTEVMKQSEDIYIFVSGINADPAMARRFLSLPVYVIGPKEKNIKTKIEEINSDLCQGERTLAWAKKECEKDHNINLNYRIRAKELLKDIFPGDDNFIPPIFMPPTVSKNLNGPFAYLKEIDYAKCILFSAYTNVPPLLKEITNEKLQEILGDANSVDTGGDKKVFEEYLGGILDGLDFVIKSKVSDTEITEEEKNNEKDAIVRAIVGRFSSETSSKIIVKSLKKYASDKDIAPESYWEKVKEYCEWGDFGAVLEEFLFLLKKENENEENPKSMSACINVSNVGYAVEYTSKSKTTELNSNIDSFQTPFYPFCFFLSSVAQEGLDFHWYCDRIVHWNVPSSPIALLQREGRINRYRCFSLRKVLNDDLMKKYGDEYKNSVNNMKTLFEFAETKSGDFTGSQGFYPDHLSINNEPLPIRRKCYYYPLSEEYFRWKDLIVNMEFYRSLFGGWERNDRISDDIINYIKEQEAGGNSIMIDISPTTHEQN